MSVFIGDKAKRVELAERKDAINPNLLSNSKRIFQPSNSAIDNYQVYEDSAVYLEQGQTYTISGKTNGTWSGTHDGTTESDRCVLWFVNANQSIDIIVSSDNQVNNSNHFVWTQPTGTYFLRVNGYKKDNSTKVWDIKVEKGSVATQWCPAYGDYARKPDIASLQNAISNGLAGKADKSQISTDIPLPFKGTLTSTDDMNKALESGMYITDGAAPQNFPPSDRNHGMWGTILVYNHDVGQILQLWLIQGNVFHRWVSYNMPQTEWQRYADQSDITSLQTAVETGYMKKPTVISQADYDKLATKDPNTLYEITE